MRLFLLLGSLLLAGTLHAQPVEGAWAWKPLHTHAGVAFYYIFYPRADNVHNGVVVLIHNTNAYAVDYRFKIVFRSGGAEQVETVQGALEAGQSKTGEPDGLFWIPFQDDRTIEEVGVRGYQITRRPGAA
jgi:hypothetical protein